MMKEKKVLRHNSNIAVPVYYDENGCCWLKLVLPGTFEASKPVIIFHRVIFHLDGGGVQLEGTELEILDSDVINIALDEPAFLFAEQVEEQHHLE